MLCEPHSLDAVCSSELLTDTEAHRVAESVADCVGLRESVGLSDGLSLALREVL